MIDAPLPTPRATRAEVRERLLRSAAELFSARTIHNTTLDDIAAAAGFTKGAVYSNFSSKEDLIAQLMRRQTGDVLESIQELVNPGISVHDLPEVVRQIFAPFSSEQRETLNLLSELRLHVQSHPELLPDFVAQRKLLHDAIATVVDTYFDGETEAVIGLSAETFATVLVATNVGVTFDAAALDGVGQGDVLAQLVAALTRNA